MIPTVQMILISCLVKVAPASASTCAARPTATIVMNTSLTSCVKRESTGTTTRIDWDRIIYALHQVETGGRLGPILGDGGAALGPLQIHRGYHSDSNVPGAYDQVSDLEYATRVVRAYMARYATAARLGRPVTPEDIARIHNGGPNGHKKKATLGYAKKFMEYYNGYVN